MTDRPILFSGPMVRAILDGRKTQTRRVIKGNVEHWEDIGLYIAENPCPYGVPGDRLWVRETGWQRPERTPRMMREGADTWERYYYDADGLGEGDHEQFKAWGFKRRPAIHMPRWASRLTLEVVNVRVERLQEITPADAIAEGIPPAANSQTIDCDTANPVHGFRSLWDSINAKRAPWNSNPWVWVIEFRRIT